LEKAPKKTLWDQSYVYLTATSKLFQKRCTSASYNI